MTNREWLMNKLANMSDEIFAHTFLENNPTCSDDYGWVDRYTNPFNRRYETYQREGFFGEMQDHTEEIFPEDPNGEYFIPWKQRYIIARNIVSIMEDLDSTDGLLERYYDDLKDAFYDEAMESEKNR